MSTRLAAWVVLLDGMELLEVPYKDRHAADEYCKDYNDGVNEFCPGQPLCYVNLVKRPVEHYPDAITKIETFSRRIGGSNPETGEGWSKTFYHVNVHSLVKDKYPVLTRFIGHYYRGEYRITGVCGSLDLEAFSKWVEKRWPEEHGRVYKEFLK